MVTRKQDDDEGFFSVVAVTCFRKPDGSHEFAQTVRINFMRRSTAYEQCDRLQDQIDEDCDPARAYVIDADGVVIRAGRPAYLPPNYFLTPERPYKTERSRPRRVA